MRVISVPFGLRNGTLLLLLSIPLAAAEVLVASKAPWWRLPYREMFFWSAAVGLLILPITLWLRQGRPWAFPFATVLAFVWLGLSAWVAIRTRHPGLAYFTIGLAGYFIAVLSSIRRELSRSFFDPRLRWYQGLPRKLPGLKCQLLTSAGKEEFDVCRLDPEGAFVFSSALARSEADTGLSAASAWLSGGATEAGGTPDLAFVFRDREVRCKGHVRRSLTRGIGAGVEFEGMTPDMRKELGDFVENLRGEGYAV